MSSVIDGSSWKSLKHFRNTPAALPVFWAYCSMLNKDNVAWPSLRGLAKITGWSVNTCSAARKWLVEHGALERVSGYVRPKWAELPPEQRNERLNLDRSEYYRPTGLIVVDGTSHALLYYSNTPAEAEDHDDVSSGVTSHAVDHGQDDTELDSISELDSMKDSSGAEKTAPESPTPPKSDKPPSWNAMMGAVITHLKEPAGTAVSIAEQLLGIATKGQRAEFNCDPPATPEDIEPFVKHYRKHNAGASLPTSSEALYRHWYKYTADRPALQLTDEPELDGPHAYLRRIREERDRAREAAFLSAS